jgi:AcrR family transcriptional regulator
VALSKRQTDIVDAALAILVKDGVDALTVKRIADHVGFKDAAIYRHFKSKADILVAIVDLFAENAAAAVARLKAANIGPVASIRDIFLDRCRTFAQDMAVTTVMFSDDMFKRENVLAARVMRVMKQYHDMITAAIVAGQKQRQVVALAPEHLFLIIMGALRLLVTQWLAANKSFDLEAAGRELWGTLESIIVVKI